MKRSAILHRLLPAALIAGTSFFQVGCTEDYAPTTGTSAEAMFATACSGCHKDKEDLTQEQGKTIFFSLSKDMATVSAISEKVHNGGMIMPKFPNIQETEMEALAQYIIDHSVIEE